MAASDAGRKLGCLPHAHLRGRLVPHADDARAAGFTERAPAGAADRRLGRWVLATAQSLGERSDQLVVRMGCTIPQGSKLLVLLVLLVLLGVGAAARGWFGPVSANATRLDNVWQHLPAAPRPTPSAQPAHPRRPRHSPHRRSRPGPVR